VSRCLSIYSETSLELRLRRLLREWEIPNERFSIGRSSSLVRAWLVAGYRVEEKAIPALSVAAIAGAIDPTGKLLRERPELRGRIRAMVETLYLLGVRTLGSLRKLPSDSAISRFGGLYETAIRNLEPGAEAGDAWERFRPAEKMSERADLNAGETLMDLEPALFHAKSLLDRVLRRAAGRGKALAKIELRLECEKRRHVQEPWCRSRLEFAFPQASTAPILRSLREKLARELEKKPLESPIVALELEALELAPRRPAQSNFFDTEEARMESERETWRDLVTDLATKLAPERELYQAELLESRRPEKSWKRVLKEPERLEPRALPIPERPLRMLSPPMPLRRLGRYLFWNDVRFTIVDYSKLERLSGDWWEEDGGFSRTYYRVQVVERKLASDERKLGSGENERELWIYREQKEGGEQGGLFLHGIF
jgi:hypothetical protein